MIAAGYEMYALRTADSAEQSRAIKSSRFLALRLTPRLSMPPLLEPPLRYNKYYLLYGITLKLKHRFTASRLIRRVTINYIYSWLDDAQKPKR